MAEPSGSVQSIPTGFSSSSKAAKATVINDVAFLAPQARSTTSLDVRPSLLQQRTTIREQKTIEELERLEITRRKIIEVSTVSDMFLIQCATHHSKTLHSPNYTRKYVL